MGEEEWKRRKGENGKMRLWEVVPFGYVDEEFGGGGFEGVSGFRGEFVDDGHRDVMAEDVCGEFEFGEFGLDDGFVLVGNDEGAAQEFLGDEADEALSVAVGYT